MTLRKKTVYSINVETGKVTKYESVAEAAEAVYGNRYSINRAIDGKVISYGHRWTSKKPKVEWKE